MRNISPHRFVEFLSHDGFDADAAKPFSQGAMRRRALADDVAMRISHLGEIDSHHPVDVLPFEMKKTEALFELGVNWQRQASESPGNIQNTVAEHIAIAEAIRDRDQDRAEAAQEAHIRSILRSTLEVTEMDKRTRAKLPNVSDLRDGSTWNEQPAQQAASVQGR